jgi:hypothetical protein
MGAVADHATRPQPRGCTTHPEHFEKVLEAPCPFYGGQVKHLLKDCTTIRGYIRGTLGQQGKA